MYQKNRINRNIVECKLGQQQKIISAICINRNIVECKYGQNLQQLLNRRRINRNIVECK